MRILRPIRRLPRHPNAATSHAPMHRLSSPWRPPISFMASTVPRWWSPLPTRRVSPLMGPLTPPVRRVSRFPWEPRYMTTISRVKGNESDKPSMRQPVSSANVIIPSQDNKNSAIIQGMKIVDTRDTISDVTARDEKSDKDACRATSEVLCVNYNISGQIMKHSGFCEEDRRSEMEEQRGGVVVSDDKEVTDDEDCSMDIVLPKSRHRDGSIYRGIMDTWWKREYLIADRNETRLEAMRFSNPSNCIEDDGTCWQHFPRSMLQILSLELAKIHNDGGLVELYGYIAVRDDVDPLLNYIVNFSRDDPIIVEQGSVINMMGPKRGIELMDSALIEYDMRIKTGEQEKDDLQLIDGASIICPPGLWNEPFSIDIPGDYGAVDITVAHLHSAVEATVEVVISEVQSGFNLLLGCLTSDVNKEMRLFDGAIVESRFLKRSVVAVLMESSLDLKFKVGASPSSFDQHCVSFKAKIHGHDTQEIKTDFALISVKVTWSTLPSGL